MIKAVDKTLKRVWNPRNLLLPLPSVQIMRLQKYWLQQLNHWLRRPRPRKGSLLVTVADSTSPA